MHANTDLFPVDAFMLCDKLQDALEPAELLGRGR